MNLVIVSPVLNDWAAFGELVERLGRLDDARINNVKCIAVDDGSSTRPDIRALNARKGFLAEVRVIRLACNLGAIRAIAVGLVAASKFEDIDAAVVMDADGEDRPEDVAQLLACWREHPEKIVVAKRVERSEGLMFKCCYSLYKLIFKLLTGQSIAFGNFSLLPRDALLSLTHNPAIWNNLAAGIMRSRIPFAEVKTNRGVRYFGQSSMNFVALAVHGISSISVYTDVVLLRIAVAMGILALCIFLGAASIVVATIVTAWVIPDWASYLFVSLTIILLQTLIFAGLALFQFLSFRSMKAFVPASDVGVYILDPDFLDSKSSRGIECCAEP
jgi:glycosyltransferase involved in cell wall biosynthesis